MSRTPSLLVAVVLSLSLSLSFSSACTRTGSPATPAPEASALRSLCLAPLAHDDPALKAPPAWTALAARWLHEARTTHDEGLALHAEACADLALESKPDDAVALGLRGVALLSAHRFTEARAIARKLTGAEPRDVRGWGILADAALELGELDDAIVAAQRMVDLKPGLASYARAAHLAWLQGDAAAAKRTYREAIAAAGPGVSKAWALTQAAELFRHEGDLDGANAGYALALEEDADYPPALVGRAKVALAKDDAAAAVTALVRATREADSLEAEWLLADALAAAGEEERARAMYAVVEREGRAHDARTFARYLNARDGDVKETLRLARSELAQRPGVHTRDVVARALLRAGDVSGAREVLAPSLAYGELDSSLLLTRAALLWAEGDRVAAQALAERALDQNPHVDTRGIEHVLPEGAPRL